MPRPAWYQEALFFKNGNMDWEIRERTVKCTQVIGSLRRILKCRNVSMKVKRRLRNNTVLSTLMYTRLLAA